MSVVRNSKGASNNNRSVGIYGSFGKHFIKPTGNTRREKKLTPSTAVLTRQPLNTAG